VRAILFVSFYLLIAGCQSIPKDLSTVSVMEFADAKYNVMFVSWDVKNDTKSAKLFNAKYTIQDKVTVSLPGVEGIFFDFSKHCISQGASPQLVQKMTLICSKSEENLYAVNAVEGARDAWLQVVEPKTERLKSNRLHLSSYAIKNFKSYVGSDIRSSIEYSNLNSLRVNFPGYF
tara:strand:+ start:255 stop:779 length:525 start_codon:yes stop_codon:yes gene_type:complete